MNEICVTYQMTHRGSRPHDKAKKRIVITIFIANPYTSPVCQLNSKHFTGITTFKSHQDLVNVTRIFLILQLRELNYR